MPLFQRSLTRRSLLRRAAAGTAGLAAAPLLAAPAPRETLYGPFRMGIQSYSLRGYDLDRALQVTRELGLHYWEAFPAHVPLTTDVMLISSILNRMRTAGVDALAHGVHAFTRDREANKAIFDGAIAMSILTLTADPDPDAFDSLEELTHRYKINIAIHNHGPGHRYGTLQQVADAVKGRGKRIGACVDTGHFLQAGEDPVRVVETLGERVLDVHLKDGKKGGAFTVLGKGDLDLTRLLKALRALNYKALLALEYEENPQNPVADLRECLAAVREAVQHI